LAPPVDASLRARKTPDRLGAPESIGLEGKDYRVQEGDILHVRFAV